MFRRLKLCLIGLAAALVLGVALVWALPEIVKWQALKQIPVTTGRAVAIEDIDINLFTGRVAIKKFRLAEPDPSQAFIEWERLDVRVIPWSPIFGHIRIAEVVLTAPTVNLVRLSPTEFNFSDILARLAASPAPGPPPSTDPQLQSRGTVGLDRVALIRANISVTDRAVKPASEWKVRDLSQNRVRIVNGKLTALSRGNSWATNLAVTGPDAKEPPLRFERMEINGIDFGWPTHVRVNKVLLRKPVNEIERAADGTLNVQKLFTPTPKPGAPSPPADPKPSTPAKPTPAGGPEAKPPDLLQTMELYFKEIVIEDGYVRFLDRTTQPPFSNDISKLTVSVKDLSNKPSQRATVLTQAVIGGDATLEVRGEMAAIGAPTYINMTTDLNKLAPASANPYVDGAIAWIIRRGQLTAKLESKIDKDQLDLKNDILIGNLRVAPSRPSDEVKKRIGLPLGLIVALIKDGDGNIHVNVPISGTLTEKKFDFSDAIVSPAPTAPAAATSTPSPAGAAPPGGAPPTVAESPSAGGRVEFGITRESD